MYVFISQYKYPGLARTIYIRCIYGIFGWEVTKYTVIHGAFIRFWPTLQISEVLSSNKRAGGKSKQKCIYKCTHTHTHTHTHKGFMYGGKSKQRCTCK